MKQNDNMIEEMVEEMVEMERAGKDAVQTQIRRLHSLPSSMAFKRRIVGIERALHVLDKEGLAYDSNDANMLISSLWDATKSDAAVAGDVYHNIKSMLDYVVIGITPVDDLINQIERLQKLLVK